MKKKRKHFGSMENSTWPMRARSWVGLPVRLGTVQLGSVANVIANESLGHVLGFEVAGHDACGRFLPWVAADVEPDHVAARSVYSLLSPTELAVFLERGARISEQADDLLVDGHGDVVGTVAQQRVVRSARPAPRRSAV